MAIGACVVAGPYLRSGARRAGWILVVLVGAAVVARGAGLPLGTCAGAFLGWGLGSVGNLVGSAPQRKTTGEALRRTLETAGFAPMRVGPLKSPGGGHGGPAVVGPYSVDQPPDHGGRGGEGSYRIMQSDPPA